jgi:hypothetical protein
VFRTDQNNNPSAFTCNLAQQAGLVYGTDYVQGDPFTSGGVTYFTAKILVDPITTTIKLIDAVGYFTKFGTPRWTYIALPKFVWDSLAVDQKRDVIGFHYQHEGGETMRDLFPNYGAA